MVNRGKSGDAWVGREGSDETEESADTETEASSREETPVQSVTPTPPSPYSDEDEQNREDEAQQVQQERRERNNSEQDESEQGLADARTSEVSKSCELSEASEQQGHAQAALSQPLHKDLTLERQSMDKDTWKELKKKVSLSRCLSASLSFSLYLRLSPLSRSLFVPPSLQTDQRITLTYFCRGCLFWYVQLRQEKCERRQNKKVSKSKKKSLIARSHRK